MRYTKEQRKEILERFKESNLKVRQFCSKEKIVPATLYRWIKLTPLQEVEAKNEEVEEKDELMELKDKIAFLNTQVSYLEKVQIHLLREIEEIYKNGKIAFIILGIFNSIVIFIKSM